MGFLKFMPSRLFFFHFTTFVPLLTAQRGCLSFYQRLKGARIDSACNTPKSKSKTLKEKVTKLRGLRGNPLSSRVTAPQLTLLETVMRRMDRVDAWICNNGGGHGLNVFTVIPTSCHFSITWRLLLRDAEGFHLLHVTAHTARSLLTRIYAKIGGSQPLPP